LSENKRSEKRSVSFLSASLLKPELPSGTQHKSKNKQALRASTKSTKNASAILAIPIALFNKKITIIFGENKASSDKFHSIMRVIIMINAL